jgi:radical SAM superfamily enzyme YgiQ (UPF0313 family)
MNRPRVGYLTFGRDDFGYGLALCLSELRDCDLYRVTSRTAREVDWLVFSCFWWEHIYVLADFLRSAGIKKSDAKRPRIVIGGFNTANPVPFLAYADYVVVGDGEGALQKIIAGEIPDNVLTDGKQSVAYGVSGLQPFCHETNDIARIEIARGCRAACRFCAVTWLKPYRELSLSGIKQALQSTKLKRVSLFAPEPTLHTQDEKVTIACHNNGKVRVDSDVRLDRLHLRKDSVPRVGIEGLSERLRKSVGKPYSNDRILDAVRRAIEDGRKGMFWYVILDLPGETDKDWGEFRELLRAVGSIPGSDKFILKPSPSVFMPTPHTPMQWDGIHWDRDYHARWERFFGRGDDRDWEVIMAERSRVFSGHMRLLSMVSTRSGDEFAAFERLASANKAIGISAGRPIVRDKRMLLKCVEKFGGAEEYCGEKKRGPWEIVLPPSAHKV